MQQDAHSSQYTACCHVLCRAGSLGNTRGHTAALPKRTLHEVNKCCHVQVRVLSVGDNKVALTTRSEEDRRDATELKSQGAGVKADGAANSLEAALQRAGFAKSKKKVG